MTLRLISFIFIFSVLMPSSLKDEYIIQFIEARYAGDDSTVYSMISDDFRYFHTPYVGLGIKTRYQDGSLLITEIVNDSLQTKLDVGDQIQEINGEVVSENLPMITGKVGDEIRLIVTKIGDFNFREIVVPLFLVQLSQNDSTFLNDIIQYSNSWNDYQIEILDIILEKDKAAISYHWEGSKVERGPVFHFYAMEIIYLNRKTDYIYRIDGLWSEKQFRDQFR